MTGMQSHLSEVGVGDILIAVDHYNVSLVSAKQSQKLLGSLSWPIILTFTTPFIDKNADIKKEENAKKRTFNMCVIICSFKIKV